jgi:hypothetical protein
MSGYKRTIIEGDFTRKRTNGDAMLDCVTLKTKMVAVEQAGFKPPYAWVTTSRVINRNPALQDAEAAMVRAINAAKRTIIYPNQPGYRYCSGCAEWVAVENFSPKATMHDKLHSHCKPCRARHAKRMYWLQKEEFKKAA